MNATANGWNAKRAHITIVIGCRAATLLRQAMR